VKLPIVRKMDGVAGCAEIQCLKAVTKYRLLGKDWEYKYVHVR